MILIYVFMAVLIYSSIYVRTKDRLNLIGVGSAVWLCCAGLASFSPLYDHSIQRDFSFETHISIFLAAVFFAMPAIISSKNYPKRLYINFSTSYIYFTKYYYLFVNFIALFSIISFFIRFYGDITNPALMMDSSGDLKKGVPDAIPFLHYFEYLTPYVSLIFLFEIKFNNFLTRKRRMLLMLYILFSVASIFLYKVSRGDLIILISGWLFMNYYESLLSRRRKSFKFKFFVFALLPMLVVILGLIRISANSRVSTHFSGDSFVFFSQIYTYISFGFQNLNTLVLSDTQSTYVWSVWRFILKFFYAGDFKESFNIYDFDTLFFNARTFIYYFYHDLGLLGVALYSFLIGVFMQLLYRAFYFDNRFLLMLCFLVKPVFFMFFGNYFFGEFILFFPYFFSLLIVFLLRLRSS